MKVLLIATNRERSPYPVAPLGAISVAAAAQRAGHQVDLLDMMFVRSYKRAIRAVLAANDYQAVAFSIRNLDNCLYHCPKSYDGLIRQMGQEVQRLTNVPLILGGSGFSLAPRTWLKHLNASYGVVGEGENAFPALLEQIPTGQNAQNIPGVIGSDNNGEVSFASSDVKMDQGALPAHELCEYNRYFSCGGYISVQTKRGCPYGCIYCTYPQLEGNKYRLREPESIVDEIELANGSNEACAIYFADSVFNTPREHALSICHEIIRRKLKIQWLTYCNPLQFDSELAKAMVSAGCVGVEFGLDSATEKMLSVMQKPFTISDIRNSLRAAAKAKLPFAVHLLFGGPGETVADIQDTQKFLDSCENANAVFATLGIRVYAGTPIEKMAIRECVYRKESSSGLPSESELFEPVYYLSPALSDEPIQTLDRIARKRPQWSTATDWNGLIMRILQKLMNRSGNHPQWLNASNYGKYMRW
jgi:radical SAM superfamily enzyme YgiQ (UPF0313 family)